jgi:hypothetical protein
LGKTPKDVVQSHDVLPPERDNFSCCMWDFVMIVFKPDQLNPRDWLFVVEVM